jgi:hypothetical protein
MNQKYPSNLDPKLREAYDRVMGTGTPQPKNSNQPNPEPPKPTTTMVTEPTTPKHQEAKNDSGVIHYGPDTHTKHQKEVAEVKQPVQTTPTTDTKTGQNSSITLTLIGIIGIIFLLGYALFWAQILGFNLIPSL